MIEEQHLLDAAKQGLDPHYTVADAGTGLRAGQVAAWGDKPCHGDVFHVRQQCEALTNVLARLAKGLASRREALELEMSAAKDGGDGRQLSARLGRARQAEVQARHLATDVKTLTGYEINPIIAQQAEVLSAIEKYYDESTTQVIEEIIGLFR